MQSPSIVALWNIWRRKWQPKLQVTKKRSHEWIRNLPQTPEKKLLLSATWLGFQKKRKGTWKAGCQVCAHFNDTQARAFRSFDVDVLKFSNLRRHHKSKFHKNNVQGLMGKSVGVSAPTESQFLRVWDELQKGVSPHSLDIDNMKAAKIYRMVFCLSEALYAKDREFARKAVAGSIRRDESNGRLLLYFSLVSKNLQCQKWGAWCQKRISDRGQSNHLCNMGLAAICNSVLWCVPVSATGSEAEGDCSGPFHGSIPMRTLCKDPEADDH